MTAVKKAKTGTQKAGANKTGGKALAKAPIKASAKTASKAAAKVSAKASTAKASTSQAKIVVKPVKTTALAKKVVKTTTTAKVAPKAASKKSTISQGTSKAAPVKSVTKVKTTSAKQPSSIKKTTAKVSKTAIKSTTVKPVKVTEKTTMTKAAPSKTAIKKTPAKAAVKPASKAVKAEPKVLAKAPVSKVAAKAAPKMVTSRSVPAAAKPAVSASNQIRNTVTGAPAARTLPANDVSVDFCAGDYVVYPAHGVGTIEGVETQSIAGMTVTLYAISFEKDRMRLKIPVQKAQSAGLRKLSTGDRLKDALKTLTGKARVKRTMWSRRAQEYEAKINSGDPVQIAEVLRDLRRPKDDTEQSYSERQIYQSALERLAREVAAVERIAEDKAAERLEDVLTQAAA